MPIDPVVEGEPIATAWGNDVAGTINANETSIAANTAAISANAAAAANASNLTSGTLPAARLPALSGDVSSAAGSAVTAIGAGKVTLAQMANMTQDQFIVRTSAGSGAPQLGTVTAAGRAILDDPTVAAIRATLGLGMTIAEIQRVASSGDLTLTVAAQDIPGATVTMTVVAGDVLLAIGVCDLQVSTLTAATNALGTLLANAVAQAGVVIVSSDALKRGTGAQVWVVAGLAAGARILKLQGNISGAGPTVVMKGTHTTLTVVRLSAP